MFRFVFSLIFLFPLQWSQIILEKLISEIGNGWAPAIADSAEKLEHIREGLKLLTDHISFWIGGSANAAGTIEHSKYMVDDTGEWMWNIWEKITRYSYDSKHMMNTQKSDSLHLRFLFGTWTNLSDGHLGSLKMCCGLFTSSIDRNVLRGLKKKLLSLYFNIPSIIFLN